NQLYPQVAIDGLGDAVFTWSSQSSNGHWDVYARLYGGLVGGLLGGLLGTTGKDFKVNTTTSGNQMYSSVGMDALGEFVIAWQSQGSDGSWDIRARYYTGVGIPLSLFGDFQVDTPTAGDKEFPSVGMNGLGSAVITWSSYGQDGS